MRVLVVGSGAAAVHFALSALERGHAVEMVDVGYAPPAPILPETPFPDLPHRLTDPVEFFLGPEGRHALLPAPSQRLYEFPPSKAHVFRRPASFAEDSRGIQPYFSFAQGGLGEAWTGGSYEYSEADFNAFPFAAGDMAPFYTQVVRRVGISGERDDLTRFSPLTAPYQPPLPLDPHSALLLERYRKRRAGCNRHGFYLGRSRVATLSEPLGDREACSQLGRCFWGCPRHSLYVPSATLRDLKRRDGFTYRPGRLALHFDTDGDGTIRGLVVENLERGIRETWTADLYTLAAGALNSSKIYLDTLLHRTGIPERLSGLVDNRMALVPFLTPSLVGRTVDTAAYQFHLLAFGIEAKNPEDHAHGQVTTLKAASIHPIVQSLPTDLATSLALFQRLRGGLGVAALWLSDHRDQSNFVTVAPSGADGRSLLRVIYHDPPGEAAQLRWAWSRLRRGLSRLGAFVPPGMTRVQPHGIAAHYGGTIPMTSAGGGHTLTPEGRSRVFPNLVIADGAGFPFLPAKNHTLTLMANAARIASRVLP